jgi:hypothetical protein
MHQPSSSPFCHTSYSKLVELFFSSMGPTYFKGLDMRSKINSQSFNIFMKRCDIPLDDGQGDNQGWGRQVCNGPTNVVSVVLE